MNGESIELHILSVFALLSFFVILLINKYSNFISKGALLDKDYSKPQAFHKEAVPRSGGLAIIFLFVIFIFINNFLFENNFLDYLIISFLLFVLGFLDDLKINLSPNIRLIAMIAVLILSINFLSVEINRTGFFFLDEWLKNNIFQTIFVLLCFIFIINGSNFIDGFNGLLCIHFIIINVIFLSINLSNSHLDFSFFITGQIVIILTFLFFNFPSGKIFLGDGGSYMIGALTALNAINTSHLNPYISPVLFAVILFYLFFEVFFSFIRKVYSKKSPLQPDELHLHMLIYKKLETYKSSSSNNYLTSLIINFSYLALLSPLFFFYKNHIFLRYAFIGLVVTYVLIYFRIRKNQLK